MKLYILSSLTSESLLGIIFLMVISFAIYSQWNTKKPKKKTAIKIDRKGRYHYHKMDDDLPEQRPLWQYLVAIAVGLLILYIPLYHLSNR
ncbi:MAG: hypothetical protein WBA16_06815 [Nonlabens sp.]